MANRRNLLVTLADKNYIPQIKQLFSSVYWNAGWEGDYMLLSHEIPEEELKWFTDKGILIKRCYPLYDGQVGEGFYPISVLDKFYLFTEEFKKWEHIVFLDSDIIVRASLDKLTKSKSFSSPNVCKDYFWAYFSVNESEELTTLKIEYNLKRPAFNSGVISFDTNIIKEDTFEGLMTIFKKYASICNGGDDPVLNLFFYDQWIKLPLVYNVLVNHDAFRKRKGIILHFFKHHDYPPLWESKNSYYQEWKTNLEKAEFIDLNKIQKVKKWNILEIKYYSLLIRIRIYYFSFIYSSFRNKLESLFRYKLISLFRYFIKTPDRFIGEIGILIKKINPDLYNKLKKLKGGK